MPLLKIPMPEIGDRIILPDGRNVGFVAFDTDPDRNEIWPDRARLICEDQSGKQICVLMKVPGITTEVPTDRAGKHQYFEGIKS